MGVAVPLPPETEGVATARLLPWEPAAVILLVAGVTGLRELVLEEPVTGARILLFFLIVTAAMGLTFSML